MPPLVYPDTSFLLALYGSDDFTDAARATLSANGATLLLCDLNRLEFLNALRLLRFRKLATPRFVADAMRAFDLDAQTGLLRMVALAWPEAVEIAYRLSDLHTAKGGCRMADILHVAAAQAHHVEGFYSFDERQRRLARHAGFALNRQR